MDRSGIFFISLSIFVINNKTFATLIIQNIEIEIFDKEILACTINVTGENPKSIDFVITVKKMLEDIVVSFLIKQRS